MHTDLHRAPKIIVGIWLLQFNHVEKACILETVKGLPDKHGWSRNTAKSVASHKGR
jgi:hypothetical protein